MNGLAAGLAWAIGAVVIVLVCWAGIKTLQTRREAELRIRAARVRSGHVPLEIPTVRGSLEDAPDTYPEWAKQGRHEQIVVDEQPQIHIRYIDMFGKVNERTIHVEHLDLQKRTIVARGDSIDEPRLFPLEKIQVAKNIETGKTFNLGTWADAVRAARRRRASHEDNFDEAQFV